MALINPRCSLVTIHPGSSTEHVESTWQQLGDQLRTADQFEGPRISDITDFKEIDQALEQMQDVMTRTQNDRTQKSIQTYLEISRAIKANIGKFISAAEAYKEKRLKQLSALANSQRNPVKRQKTEAECRSTELTKATSLVEKRLYELYEIEHGSALKGAIARRNVPVILDLLTGRREDREKGNPSPV